MRSDFQTNWILRWFAPHNVVRYWLTDFDRSDIMERVFDRFLFKGKPLAAMGVGRPRILLNATSRTRADTFVFTDQAFTALGSCLADYPLSHAVMASGAFPGALEDVTLENYLHPQQPGETRRYFEHLYDGGAVDNLGVETLRQAVRALWNESRGARPKKCFLFIVDAYTNPERPDRERERDPRQGIDYIVNTNVISAFDALLSARRSDVLWNLGFAESEIGLSPFQAFDLAIDDYEGSPTIPCAAWHLTFQRLILGGKEGVPLALDAQEMARTNHVGGVVNRIRTRYNLASPDPYTDQELQDYLFEAAARLVRQDTFAKPRACQWFKDNGYTVCEDRR